MTSKGRVLGIDPGSVRIGLAITDTSRILATPFQMVKAGDTEVDNIVNIINDEHIAEVVIGLPLSLDGSESEGSLRARELAKKLQETLGEGVPISFQDERFSSRLADRGPVDRPRLSPKKNRQKRESGERDMASAQVILSSWLDSHRL